MKFSRVIDLVPGDCIMIFGKHWNVGAISDVDVKLCDYYDRGTKKIRLYNSHGVISLIIAGSMSVAIIHNA